MAGASDTGGRARAAGGGRGDPGRRHRSRARRRRASRSRPSTTGSRGWRAPGRTATPPSCSTSCCRAATATRCAATCAPRASGRRSSCSPPRTASGTRPRRSTPAPTTSCRKPFSFVVLVARLRALLRRGAAPSTGRARRRATSTSIPPTRECDRGDVPISADRPGVRAPGAPHAPPRRGREQGRRSSTRCGVPTATATPTWWRCSSATCAARSTPRSSATAW